MLGQAAETAATLKDGAHFVPWEWFAVFACSIICLLFGFIGRAGVKKIEQLQESFRDIWKKLDTSANKDDLTQLANSMVQNEVCDVRYTAMKDHLRLAIEPLSKKLDTICNGNTEKLLSNIDTRLDFLEKTMVQAKKES